MGALQEIRSLKGIQVSLGTVSAPKHFRPADARGPAIHFRLATAHVHLSLRADSWAAWQHVAVTDETPAQKDRKAERQAAAAEPEAAR